MRTECQESKRRKQFHPWDGKWKGCTSEDFTKNRVLPDGERIVDHPRPKEACKRSRSLKETTSENPS